MIKPSDVRSRAETLEEKNNKFRTFLKNRADPDELDKQFLDLHNELFTEYDCTLCRNCCKEYAAVLTEDEVETIAEFLELDKDEFIKQYVEESRDDSFELRSIPCCFLGADNKCLIESCKPQNCIDYPFTNKPERLWSLFSVIDSTFVCPVVFELIERLKKTYRFRN